LLNTQTQTFWTSLSLFHTRRSLGGSANTSAPHNSNKRSSRAFTWSKANISKNKRELSTFSCSSRALSLCVKLSTSAHQKNEFIKKAQPFLYANKHKKTPKHRAESHKIEKFEMPRRVYFLIKKEFASHHVINVLVFAVRQLKREKKVARSR
jgi:hypothetical protein